MSTIQIISVCDTAILNKTIDRVSETQSLLTKINSNLDIIDPKIVCHIEPRTESGVEIESSLTPVNKENYSFYMTKMLQHHIKSDYILVVQYDSGIVNADAWTDEFLEYDYIGAPWRELGHLSDFFGNSVRVGNGGFSLRSARLHHTVSQLVYPFPFPYPSPDFFKEDVHITCKVRHTLENKGIRFGNLYIANKFAAETGLKDKNKLPFGAHGSLYDDIKGKTLSTPKLSAINLLDKTTFSDLKL